ncbi:MAG: hypothetical protein FWE37_08650 [Spirochaetaceae bacterium]|nr:hypothetical protein [Spirochaetaceae bacterium]
MKKLIAVLLLAMLTAGTLSAANSRFLFSGKDPVSIGTGSTNNRQP